MSNILYIYIPITTIQTNQVGASEGTKPIDPLTIRVRANETEHGVLIITIGRLGTKQLLQNI